MSGKKRAESIRELIKNALQAKQNDVVIKELENMLQVNCKLEYKCKPISARQFLAGIQHTSDVELFMETLDLLIDHVTCMLEPQEMRPDGWDYIDFKSEKYLKNYAHINGIFNFLSKLGYNEKTEDGIKYLETALCKSETPATLVSLLVMQNDLVHYLKHDHPNPTHVSTLLEGDLRDDIEDPNYSFAKLRAKMEESKKPGSPLKKAESTVSSDGGTDDEDEDIIVLDNDCVVCGDLGIATLYCESCKAFSCDDCSLITHRHKLKRNHNPYTLKEYYKKNPFYIPEFECELCGDEKSYWLCHDCTQKHMCKDCECIQHRHKARRDHKKETIRSYYIQHPIERPAEAIVKSVHIEMTEEQPKEHVVKVPDHDCDVCGESGIAHWRCKECKEFKFMCIDCESLKHKNKKMAHNPQTLVDYYTENPVKSDKADVLEEQLMEEDIVVPVAKAEQELIILEHDCDVCGDKDAAGYICYSCKQNLCDGCEKIYHKHIDRRGHDRKTLKQHYTDNPIKVKKHNCDVCGDNATWICQECNQYLCESCKGIVHKRPDRKSHEPQTLRAYYIANPIKDTDAEEPTEGEDQGYFEEDELASAKDISSLLNEVLTEDNIRNDVFLKKQMDTDGNIPLMAIARLPKLTKITKNVRLLKYSLQQSTKFIFTGDGKSIHMLDNSIEEPKEEETGVQCDICSGSNGSAKYFCSECDKNMCIMCEKKYHKHPKRQDHIIAELMENSPNLNDEAEPELPDPKEIYCDVCIEVGKVEVSCGKCDHHFCKVCEKNWHSHPARRGHTVVPIMEFLIAEAEEAKITDPSQIIPKFEEMTEMKSRDERDEIVRDVRDILTNMNDKGSDNIKRADHKMSKKVFEWMSYRLNVEQYLFAQKFGLDMPPKPNKKGIFSPIDYLKNIKDNTSKDDLKLHVKIAFEALSASAQSLCPLVADKTDISQMFAFLDSSITTQCTEVDKFSCAENMQLPKPSINTISKLQADLAQEAADKAERREQEERARVIQEQRKSAQDQKSKFESDGRELLAEIMKADKCGFNKQEIDCALMEADQRHKPFTWLQTVWLPNIKEVAELAETHGNNLGQFSIEETRAVLFLNRNNKNAAVDTLIDNRRKQTLELRKFCPATNQGNLIEALSDNHGSFNEALEYLTHKNMSNLMRNLSNRESDIPGYDVSLEALRSKSTAPETKARLAMMGCRFNSIQKGELFVSALDNEQIDAEPLEILMAIQDGKSIEEIVEMCEKECPICIAPVMRENMQNVPCCECTICKECFKHHYTYNISSKAVSKFSCPGCQQPDLINNKDEGFQHIQFLDRWVFESLDADTIDIYEKKIMEWTLMGDPSFRWCCHCSEGFVFEYHGVPRMLCKCKGESCYNCKEKWEDDHNGKTCEQYQEWKDGQDVRDLAQSLQDSGIDCPHCKFRYELARGGCMHFTCPQCRHEFCSGCTNPFINGSNCKVNTTCAGKGLHCHHPRNCLYDLRDYDVAELQKVLKDAEVEIAETAVGEERPVCIVMEQKDGGEDQPCAKIVFKLNVCETHYKEYLVQLINRNKLDVLSLFDENRLRHEFTKNDTPVPAVPAGEDAVTFLKKAIEQTFPLPNLKAARLL